MVVAGNSASDGGWCETAPNTRFPDVQLLAATPVVGKSSPGRLRAAMCTGGSELCGANGVPIIAKGSPSGTVLFGVGRTAKGADAAGWPAVGSGNETDAGATIPSDEAWLHAAAAIEIGRAHV